MQIKELNLHGVYKINLNPLIDERGFFMRTFDSDIFKTKGINKQWLQENHSKSNDKGIIRGLHLQIAPFSESKLVRCIKGAVIDVFVDLRQNSSTYGKWDKIELNEYNKSMIFIPKGFAHGFCTLEKGTEILYKVDNIYSKKHEIGILWNDKTLNINWPVQNPKLSKKDKNNITFKEFSLNYNVENNTL